MSRQVIAFIGGGNMAASLVGGLAAGGWPPSDIRVAEPRAERRAELTGRYPIDVLSDNGDAVAGASVVVLAVKPQVLRAVTAALGPRLREQGALVISIAAGVREPDIRRWLGYDAPVVRTMPTRPRWCAAGRPHSSPTPSSAPPSATSPSRSCAPWA